MKAKKTLSKIETVKKEIKTFVDNYCGICEEIISIKRNETYLSDRRIGQSKNEIEKFKNEIINLNKISSLNDLKNNIIER